MLTIYSYIPQNWHASYYYRMFVPFHTARDLGMPIRVHVDTNLAGVDPEHRVKALCESDVVLLYQPIGEPTLHNMKMAKSILPSKVDGAWKYPPSIVIDTDDNLFNVNPYNAAFRTLGMRDHEGRDIPSGNLIGDVQNGQRRVLWHDGPCRPDCIQPCTKKIDLTSNRANLDTYRQLVEMSDAVTCTTPRVEEALRAETKPRRVRVSPNLVRFDHYEQVDLAPAQRLNILWQGGASHYEDWYPLREQLGNITKKYKNVHFIIWGQLYHWVTELLPPDRYTFVNWCPYGEYKLRLMMMGHQINLAPLNDNRFNRCRSAIKFYEGSVMKRPAATLAQATGPYLDEIVDRETGLLFKTPQEFEDRLSELIENETLRLTLAKNAKDWVSENRDAMKHVPKLMAFYEELREAAPREQPHMPEVDWEPFVKQMEREEELARA